MAHGCNVQECSRTIGSRLARTASVRRRSRRSSNDTASRFEQFASQPLDRLVRGINDIATPRSRHLEES